MKRALLIVAIAMLLTVPNPASAALLDEYDLVGEDPAGDSSNQEVPGVSSGLFANTRTDIRSLEMAVDGDRIHFKLNIAATPAGTGGYMYAVHFKVGGTSYLTCWAVQWTGGNAGLTQENVLGCSRFTSETQVGPATTAAGVQVATVDGQSFVRWEVPRSAIGNPGDDGVITDLFADTWFRGVSNCCVGSQQHSQYMWNRADRGPDTGTWGDYPLAPKAPPLELNLTIQPDNVTVGPGSTVEVALNASLVGDGQVEVAFAVDGLPEGWEASFDVENVTLGAEEAAARPTLMVRVPADAANQTVELTVTADAGDGLVAQANLTILVDASLGASAPGPAGPVAGGADGNVTDTGNATGAQAEGEDGGSAALPGPGAAVVAAVLLGLALAVRRRRSLGA